MNLKPLFDRIVIEPIAQKTTTSSGLILPESSGERPLLGKVISCGDGNEVEGKKVDIVVKIGDTVVYTRYGGIEIKIEEKNLIIVRQTDILAIIEE